MKKKLSDETREFEALLKKIDKVNDIASSIQKESLSLNKSKVRFTFENKMISDEELDLRHKLINFKEWDMSLYNMLDVNIIFTKKITSRRLGDYNGERIRMNRNYEHSKWNTYVHEIGHGIQFQLGFKYIKDERKFFLRLVKELIENLSSEKLSSCSFKSLKPYIKEYISLYATKNEHELFAEIYMFAYGETSNLNKKQLCQRLIETYNKEIKKGISKIKAE